MGFSAKVHDRKKESIKQRRYIMTDDEINAVSLVLNLTVEEVNYILAVLSRQPYEQVYTLIPKIKSQGESSFRTNESR